MPDELTREDVDVRGCRVQMRRSWYVKMFSLCLMTGRHHATWFIKVIFQARISNLVSSSFLNIWIWEKINSLWVFSRQMKQFEDVALHSGKKKKKIIMSIFSHNFPDNLCTKLSTMKAIAVQRINLNVNTIRRQKVTQLTGAQLSDKALYCFSVC